MIYALIFAAMFGITFGAAFFLGAWWCARLIARKCPAAAEMMIREVRDNPTE
jgi:type IV secretory pathway TrbD component